MDSIKNTKKSASNEKFKSHDPEQEGKKAIGADKKIKKQDKSAQQIEEEEKKDAEQWRNEG